MYIRDRNVSRQIYRDDKKHALVHTLPRRCRCWLDWICLIVSSLLLVGRVANRCRCLCGSEMCRQRRRNTSSGSRPCPSSRRGRFVGHSVCNCGRTTGSGPVGCGCGIEESVVRHRGCRRGRGFRTSTGCRRVVLVIPAPVRIRLGRA